MSLTREPSPATTPVAALGRPVVVSRTVIRLLWTIGALAAFAAAVGVFWQGGAAPRPLPRSGETQ